MACFYQLVSDTTLGSAGPIHIVLHNRPLDDRQGYSTVQSGEYITSDCPSASLSFDRGEGQLPQIRAAYSKR